MSSFAIVLLSETMFGGAQKRFLNLHHFFRQKYGDKAWFIVTPRMKSEIEATYGIEFLKGVYAIGEINTKLSGDTNADSIKTLKPSSGLKKWIKSFWIFDLYFYFKSKNRTQKEFEIIDQFTVEKDIDRLLAVYTGVLPLYFYFNKQKRNKRIIFCNMDSWFSHFETNPIKRFLRQYTLFHRAHEEADHIDILSPFILEGLKAKNYLPLKQSYSITACSFIDYSTCVSGEKAELEFVFSGRLEEDKNPLLFIQAAIKLGEKYPQIKFHILGKGRLTEKINTLLSTYRLDNIIIHGYVKNPCIIFKNTSVFVSLQKENNYPSQSVLEAMACGNAVIASDVGDTRLFVSEQNGWLIQNNEEELIQAMEFCIQNPELVQSKAAFAYDYVRENFSVERASDYYYSLLYPKDGKI